MSGNTDTQSTVSSQRDEVFSTQSNGSEASSFQLTIEKLDGKNYRQWAQSIKLVIEGKGKLGYLTGETSKPAEGAALQRWKSENSMVMAWLVNSIKPSIGRTYLFLPTAKDVWDAVRETYSDAEDTSQIFEVKMKLWQMRQGDRDITDYYMEMLGLWQELDLSFDDEWECPSDSARYRKKVENERVFEFLAGLNRDLDEVRGRLLSRRPLPSTRECFAEVRREDARRRVMLKTNSSSGLGLEGSALFTKGNPSGLASTAGSSGPSWAGSNGPVRGNPNGPGATQQKKQAWCEHCHKNGHVKEGCWEIYGKPAGWKPRQNNRNRGYQATSEEKALEENKNASSAFNHEQLEQLYKLFSSFQTPGQSSSTPTGSVAQKGNFRNSLNARRDKSHWIVDSGASDHMTNCHYLFSSYIPCAGNIRVKIADGSLSPVAGKGSIKISEILTLENVLHVPKLSCNLLSISQLTKDSNCLAKFFPAHCVFQDLSSGKTIGSAKACDGLYYFEDIDEGNQIRTKTCNSVSTSRNNELLLWHSRMGHPSFRYMKHVFPFIHMNKEFLDYQCEICELAKHHRTSLPKSVYKPTKPFAMIHSDVWGPYRTPDRTRSKWFVSFIDDHSRVSWVYLLKEKTDVRTVFSSFHLMIQTQFQTQIQILRTDNGTEYFNTYLGEYLRKHGIVHQSSCANTPQQNGVAERKNKHILEVARALMFTTNMPIHFWGDAILTSTYLINRMPSRVLSFHTPLQTLEIAFPNQKLGSTLPLKVFGCVAFVHNHSHGRGKFDPRACKCVFIGYSPTQKGYKCYDPSIRRVLVSRDVTFFEQTPFFTKTSLQGETMDEARHCFLEVDFTFDSDSPNLPPQPSEKPPLPVLEHLDLGGDAETPGVTETLVYSRKPKSRYKEHLPTAAPREAEPVIGPTGPNNPEFSDLDLPIALRKAKRAPHPISKYLSYKALSSKFCAFTTNLDDTEIPKNIHEALRNPDWEKAVMEEMRALEKNETWEIVALPEGKKPVGCKWVFTVKYTADGKIDRYKARLVAKGFSQTYGIDYTETFAPVAKMNTIRVLFSLAANLDWPLQQLDIKNAFLNGSLEEEVFMTIPPGFEREGEKKQVCRLMKSLYGLKQSPRAWFDRFTRVIKTQGYKQGHSDHTMFTHVDGDGKKTILIVYVDDIILTGDNTAEMERLKGVLASEFEVKDLGQIRYFLGMEVARSKSGISISQRKYVLDLLAETGMLGCKPSDTPVEPRKKIDDAGDLVDRDRYQKLVGKLIYLSHTRPDIAFAVSVVSQHMHSPREAHMGAVYKILRYLKSCPGKGLLFQKSERKDIEVFSDADWAGSTEDRRSTTGYCTYVWGNLVTWRSKKQNVVARSSAEAEFRAVAQGICEGLWLKKLLDELQVGVKGPMKLFCDNKAAISISHNPVQHDRTKHVEVDRHFIKEKIEDGTVCITYVPTQAQTADILTKGLHRPEFDVIIRKLGMVDIYKPT